MYNEEKIKQLFEKRKKVFRDAVRKNLEYIARNEAKKNRAVIRSMIKKVKQRVIKEDPTKIITPKKKVLFDKLANTKKQ